MRGQREANEDETLYAMQLQGCLCMLDSVKKALDEQLKGGGGGWLVKNVDENMAKCKRMLETANERMRFSSSEILATVTRIVYEAERCFGED